MFQLLSKAALRGGFLIIENRPPIWICQESGPQRCRYLVLVVEAATCNVIENSRIAFIAWRFIARKQLSKFLSGHEWKRDLHGLVEFP
jgi:hypothetical protein